MPAVRSQWEPGGVFQADAGACLVSVIIWTLVLGARAFVGEEVSDFDASVGGINAAKEMALLLCAVGFRMTWQKYNLEELIPQSL